MKELYEKFVKKPLSMVDSGDLFKNGLNLVFKLAALALILFGLYVCISGLFGDYGYFNQIKGADGFLMVRCILTFLITFIISLATFVAIGLILWYQGDDIKENYDGIIFLPSRFIKIIGQIIAVSLVATGLITLISALFAGLAYSKIDAFQQFIPGPIANIIGMLIGGNLAVPPDFLAYLKSLLFIGILGLIAILIAAFIVLIIAYIFAYLYEIGVKFFKNGGDYFKTGKK
jgi:hypothetical protein